MMLLDRGENLQGFKSGEMDGLRRQIDGQIHPHGHSVGLVERGNREESFFPLLQISGPSRDLKHAGH